MVQYLVPDYLTSIYLVSCVPPCTRLSYYLTLVQYLVFPHVPDYLSLRSGVPRPAADGPLGASMESDGGVGVDQLQL